ncbi:response regulator transcription factor [Novosphingobium terrae]|uniref:response regulator transcription factor n=1 Tax=Novosphingobium terrae TaxID=2726189 RepID=UPI00197E9C7B|nr:response regulator [Novosphingobium terrae]
MTDIPVIAIVDDDAGMRQSLDGLIRSLGYRATLFESAEAFLGAPEAKSCQCVVSDLQMPGGMDGIELARAVDDRLQGRVILISAFLDDAVQERALEAGVYRFLRKPFDGEELVGCIEAMLEA